MAVIDPDELETVAGAILDGTPVTWPAAGARAAKARRAVVRELRLIASIVDSHRDTHTPTERPATDDGRAEAFDGIREWGHLTLLELIGRGAYGEVYRAWDRRLEREVAVKLMPAGTSGPLQAAVVDEARRLARVHHPNVVSIFDADTIGDRGGIWMELVRGRTLEETVRDDGRMSPAEVVAIGGMLCRALGAVHTAGLLHRDLTARNVVREETGRVVLMDFGTSRPSDAVTADPAADLRGTPLYMAPEVLEHQAASVASDIYSLGVLLYHLLTTTFPVIGRTFGAVRDAHRRHKRRRLRDARSKLPVALVRVIERALARRPSARFPNADAMGTALARSLGRRARQSSARPRHARSGPRAGAAARRRIVGRDRERSALGVALASVAEGRGHLFCVVGEAGIGKTTLVDQFLGELAEGPLRARTACGRCSERLAGTQAYLPFLDALEDLIQAGADRSASTLLRRLAPTWHAIVLPRATRRVTGPAEPSQERMFFELATFLQRLAEDRPLVLFLDDLHWGDPSTIDLIAYLASRFDTARVLLIVAYRLADLDLTRQMLEAIGLDLQARGLCTVLPVGFLSLADTARYVDVTFAGHQLAPAFSSLIYSRTEGSPLFMVDLLGSLCERGDLVKMGDRWTLAHPLPDIERDLPVSIRGMIERQLARLDQSDRLVLTTASLQGQEFDSIVVARALGRDPSEIEDRLDVLDRRRGLVRLVGEHPLANRVVTSRYRFVHVFYQHALLGAVQPARRAASSGGVARAILECYGERSRVLAANLSFLFESAREPLRAAEQCKLAAEDATGLFAYQEAAALAARGLSLLERVPESPERARLDLSLHVALGLPLWVSKGFGAAEVAPIYERARQLVDRPGYEIELSAVLSGLVLLHSARGDLESGAEVSRQLTGLAGRSEDQLMRSRAHHMAGVVAVHSGAPAAALSQLEAAMKLCRPSDHASSVSRYGVDVSAAAAAYSSWCLWEFGHIDQAVIRSRDCVTQARRLGDPFTLGLTTAGALTLHQLRREADECRAHAERLIDFSSKHGLAAFWLWGSAWHGWALAEAGRVSEGIDEIRGALASEPMRGFELIRPHVQILAAEAFGRAGHIDDGLAALADGTATAERIGPIFVEPELHRIKGELILACTPSHGDGRPTADEDEEARACFARALAIARERQSKTLELRALTSLARLQSREGGGTETLRTLSDLYASFSEGFDTFDLIDARRVLGCVPPIRNPTI